MLVKRAIESFLKGYFSTCRRSHHTIKAYSIDLKQFSKAVGQRSRYRILAVLSEALGRSAKAARYRRISSSLFEREHPESWSFIEHEFIFCHLSNFH